MSIWGDYNSVKGQQLAIRFRMCEGGPEKGCESEENIRKWLQRKFIVIIYNSIRFENEGYHDEAAVYESRLIYIPINSQVRNIQSFKVQTTHIELQDKEIIQLDEMTVSRNDQLFTLQ